MWGSLTKQAWDDKSLEEPIRVEDIARSWIYQDRFPVVTVIRNYAENTAIVRQVNKSKNLSNRVRVIEKGAKSILCKDNTKIFKSNHWI